MSRSRRPPQHIKALADEKPLTLGDVDDILRRWIDGDAMIIRGDDPMPHTLAELIIGHAAGREVAGRRPGRRPRGHGAWRVDSLAPSIIDVLHKELGAAHVHDSDRVAVFIDHVAPASNVATAENQARIRRFVAEQDICNLFDVGRGVCHQVMVEEGLAQPGQIVLGSDSHSTSYGAIGAFGTGMGSSDIALAWASGHTWLRVPETIVHCRRAASCRGACCPRT